MPDPTRAKPTGAKTTGAESAGDQGELRSLRAVDRTLGELRRGDWVVIHRAGGEAALALAAEHASKAALAPLESWGEGEGGGEPTLVLTAHRAGVLNIRPSGGDVVLLPLAPCRYPP